MEIFELYAIATERQLLKELQTAAIDQELEKVASGIGQANAARTGDQTQADMGMADPMGGQPGMGADPMGGDMGAPPMGGMDPNMPDPALVGMPGGEQEEELETKKIDTAILNQVKGMNLWGYNFKKGNDKISPEKIVQMNLDDLSQLRNIAINKINTLSAENSVGTYANPEYKWYEDLRNFTDKVLDLKKRSDKPVQKKNRGQTAKWEQKPESKNNKPKQFHNPPKPKGA